MKRWGQRLGLMILGGVIGLVALELGLWLLPLPTLNLLMTNQPMRFLLYQTDYNVGWRLRPNLEVRYHYKDEFDVMVKTNSLGLHDVEHSYQKPPQTQRLLFLGDSFTEGANVTIEQGFPYLTQHCLQPTSQTPLEVINLGVAYYATTEELFLLRHEGVRYAPDVVLVAFYVGNDLDAYTSREVDDKWFDALGGYLITVDEQHQLQKQWIDWQSPSPYEGVGSGELFLRRYSRLYYLVGHSNSKLRTWLEQQGVTVSWATPMKPAPDFRNDFELMRYAADFPDGAIISPKLKQNWEIITIALTQIKELTDSIGARLGVVIIPESSQVNVADYQRDYQKFSRQYGAALNQLSWDVQRPNQALSEWLTGRDIPVLDLLPVYQNYTQPLYFEVDEHLNPVGHAATAQAICQWITQTGLIN